MQTNAKCFEKEKVKKLWEKKEKKKLEKRKVIREKKKKEKVKKLLCKPMQNVLRKKR